MKERPILFSGVMVRAILEGRKTQTRRAIKKACNPFRDICPYGVPGDRLWVRETWCELRVGHFNEIGLPRDLLVTRYDYPRRNGAAYRATTSPDGDAFRADFGYKWRPSIHMPRWASRITLEIVSVRVERLHDISESDAADEGAGLLLADHEYWDGDPDQYRKCFRALWESINGPGSWAENPYVWAIEFKRVEVAPLRLVPAALRATPAPPKDDFDPFEDD